MLEAVELPTRVSDLDSSLIDGRRRGAVVRRHYRRQKEDANNFRSPPPPWMKPSYVKVSKRNNEKSSLSEKSIGDGDRDPEIEKLGFFRRTNLRRRLKCRRMNLRRFKSKNGAGRRCCHRSSPWWGETVGEDWVSGFFKNLFLVCVISNGLNGFDVTDDQNVCQNV